MRSRWTDMNALHYAAYFDVPELIGVVLKMSRPRGKCPHAAVRHRGVRPSGWDVSILVRGAFACFVCLPAPHFISEIV